MFGAAVAAALLLRRAPRVAEALLVVSVVWGLISVARLAMMIALGELTGIGPAAAVSIVLMIGSVAAAVALWSTRRIRRAH